MATITIDIFPFPVSWRIRYHNELLDLIKLADRKGHDIRIAQMFPNKNDRPLLDTRELIENSFSHLRVIFSFVYIYQLIYHY